MLPVSLVVKKPSKKKFNQFQPIAQHLHQARVLRKESLVEQAENIGIDAGMINHFENTGAFPRPVTFSKIVDYLGYFPLVLKTDSFGKKMKASRHCKGLSIRKASEQIGINYATWRIWESDRFIRPTGKVRQKLDSFIYD